MSWMDQIGGLLDRYTGAGEEPSVADDEFEHVTQAAPRGSVVDGIASAFRSDQTPPFAQMVGQLFQQANGEQRAGLLNTLIGAVGPALFSQILGRSGAGGLAELFGKGQRQVTPEAAEQVPPQAVEQIAAEAERQNPSIIDQVSEFFADNPALVKSLGAAAVGMVLSRMAQRR